jgi:WD40 repeat protein
MLEEFHDHSQAVMSITSSTNSSKIASGSVDKTIRVYDSRSGDVLHTILVDYEINSVCFSPDADKIVYGTSGSVVVWDLIKEQMTFERNGSSAALHSHRMAVALLLDSRMGL